MAENEWLDLGKSRRWQRVYHAIRDGYQADQVASLTGICLQKTINAIGKPIFKDGPPQVPLADLLDKLEHDPGGMDEIVRKCNGHDCARLFRDAALDAETRDEGVKKFMFAICDKFFDQVAMRSVTPDGKSTFRQVRSVLDQARKYLEPEITRMSQQLSVNPDRPLRRKAFSSEKNTVSIDTKSILKESLLGLRE